METTIYYLLKSAVCLTVFYLCYKLLLSKETWHRMNRIVLLLTMAVAFILPVCIITIYREVPQISSDVSIGDLTAMSIVEDETYQFPWETLLLSIFIIGIIVRLSITICSILKVKNIIRTGAQTNCDNGTTLVRVKEDINPFSWMKYIVISEKDYTENPNEIITHEQAHIDLRHSLDLLFVDLMTYIQWFNPVVYLLRNDLREIHEYEADEAVLNSGINAQQYQILLIKKAAGGKWYSIANSFNHSKLKNRITMMMKEKSSKWAGAKVLYFIPLVCVALTAFARVENVYAESDKTPQQVVSKSTENNPKEDPLFIVDGMELTKEVASSITPDKIANIDVLKGESATTKYGAVVITLKNDKPITAKEDVAYVEVSAQSTKGKAKTVVISPANMNDKEFSVPDKMPEFPGGVEALIKFIADNIKYPEEAKKNKWQGGSICQFIIEKNGSISDIKVTRSSGHKDLDTEAIRVIQSMPKWTPGMQDGEAVSVKYLIPIVFKL